MRTSRRSIADPTRLGAGMRTSIAVSVLGLLSMLGCGGAAAPAARTEVGARADDDASDDDRSANDADLEPAIDGAPCPASYTERAPDCSHVRVTSCVRADGAVCSCAMPTWCGGAAPPPMPASWVCEAPRRCPPIGSACTGDDYCSDAPCSWMGGQHCEGGVWRELPPGPAPP